MAMRGRGGRGSIPSRPPRLIVGRVYEQFKPMSEWRQEDDHDTLLVYLPGFQKEYIKVTTEDVKTVRIRGERLVDGNRWSRFQEDARVPENCDMRGIRARFDAGILTVTMPRKTKPPQQQPPLPNQEAAALDKQPDTRPQSPLNPTPASSSKQEPLEKQSTSEKKPDRRPQSPLKPTPAASSSSKEKPSTSSKEKKPTPASSEELKFGSLPTSSIVPKKHKHHDVKPNQEKKEASVEEIIKQVPEGIMGKWKHAVANHDDDKLEEKKKAVKEDRKLLVNVGVGVLVILALGLHVSYNIGLIRRNT